MNIYIRGPASEERESRAAERSSKASAAHTRLSRTLDLERRAALDTLSLTKAASRLAGSLSRETFAAATTYCVLERPTARYAAP